MIRTISFKRHRFPPDVIRHAAWLYFRLSLSVWDVEALLAQRGIEVSREAVRCWVTSSVRSLRRSCVVAEARRPAAAIYNTFNTQPHLIRRPTRRLFRARAHDDWAAATVAA